MSDAKELFLADGKSAGVWYCTTCRLVKRTEAEADKCCRPWVCENCGKESQKYHTLCTNCDNLRREAAKERRLADAELVEDYDGWICSQDAIGPMDGYFRSVEEFIDYCEDEEIEIPEFVHCCRPHHITVRVEDALSRLEDEGWEGMTEHLVGEKELIMAIDAFNIANAETCRVYDVDYKRKTRVRTSEVSDE